VKFGSKISNLLEWYKPGDLLSVLSLKLKNSCFKQKERKMVQQKLLWHPGEQTFFEIFPVLCIKSIKYKCM
jgi:hypothetical protein